MLISLANVSRVKSSSKKVALFEIERGEESSNSSDQGNGGGTGSESIADIPATPYEAECAPANDTSEERKGRIELHEVGNERRTVVAQGKADDLGGGQDKDAVRTLIVLFDNSYSWYKPKEIK